MKNIRALNQFVERKQETFAILPGTFSKLDEFCHGCGLNQRLKKNLLHVAYEWV